MATPDKQIEPEGRLLIVASDPDTMNRANEMFHRLRECLFAWKRFMDVCCEVDENDPRQMKRVEGAVHQLTLRFMQQYFNPSYFDADVATLAQMRVRIETLPKGEGE